MQTLTSREYKLMLKASKFKGDDEKLKATAGALWADLAGILMPFSISVSGTEDVRHKRREVRFLDTDDKWLRAHDYVVRERLDLETEERQITLKFRHVDRYVSQDRRMEPAEGVDGDLKFEEDVKPPYQAVFSFSSNTIVDEDTPLETLRHVNKLYPGLKKTVDEFPESEGLVQVGAFTAYERVIKGTSFQIQKEPGVFAMCSLTIWYGSEDSEEPIVVEFSFKYEDAKEAYSAKMARRAYDAFMAIQANLGHWIDPKPMTKTAFVYSLDPGLN